MNKFRALMDTTHHSIRMWVVALTAVLRSRSRQLVTSDRGDVPGWVLVTVMTAGLVTALWMVADDQLTALLSQAINSVSR